MLKTMAKQMGGRMAIGPLLMCSWRVATLRLPLASRKEP
jgi:hypothetical protein